MGKSIGQALWAVIGSRLDGDDFWNLSFQLHERIIQPRLCGSRGLRSKSKQNNMPQNFRVRGALIEPKEANEHPRYELVPRGVEMNSIGRDNRVRSSDGIDLSQMAEQFDSQVHKM